MKFSSFYRTSFEHDPGYLTHSLIYSFKNTNQTSPCARHCLEAKDTERKGQCSHETYLFKERLKQ